MIHTYSLGRAARYYPERAAFASGGTRSTFRELHDRIASIAAALNKHGFGVGDRLAILLPNEPDYIELVADGYFYILDRLKDMIVTGGENVYSGEVEAVIYELPAVREVAVFGIPDPQWGELVMACVALKPGNSLSKDELIAHCRQSLANYKIPRRVEFSDTELPMDGAGKILKRVLRERFWANQERDVG